MLSLNNSDLELSMHRHEAENKIKQRKLPTSSEKNQIVYPAGDNIHDDELSSYTNYL